ncbi:hypothetical protein [Roseovarius aestuariivivens]|nr:hypothetical protein [Roseovarius aestuariivivens]
MKRILIGLLALGIFFGAGLGIHATLISASQGSGTWADRAAATCSLCHGS